MPVDGWQAGTIFARAGHEAVSSYARSSQKLKRLAREASGTARHGTPREATDLSDLRKLESNAAMSPAGRILTRNRKGVTCASTGEMTLRSTEN